MSEFYDTVQSDKNFLQKIASKIPGFKGYVESTQRRASDKLLRDEIARQFSQVEARVSYVQTEAISVGAIELLDTLESSAIKLRTFADRIRGASYGYSALFAPVKIKAEDLAKIYAYDLALLALTDDLNAAVDNVERSIGTDGIDAAIRHLVRLSQEAIDAYDNRHNVIIDGGGAAEMPAYQEVPAPEPSLYESLPDDQEPLRLDDSLPDDQEPLSLDE